MKSKSTRRKYICCVYCLLLFVSFTLFFIFLSAVCFASINWATARSCFSIFGLLTHIGRMFKYTIEPHTYSIVPDLIYLYWKIYSGICSCQCRHHHHDLVLLFLQFFVVSFLFHSIWKFKRHTAKRRSDMKCSFWYLAKCKKATLQTLKMNWLKRTIYPTLPQCLSCYCYCCCGCYFISPF